MDTLETSSGIVSLETLPRWQSMEIPDYSKNEEEKESPFPCRPDLNEKLAIREGDGLFLDAMALVHPTNENMLEAVPFSETMYKMGGSELLREVKKDIKVCRTGDAKLSKGHKLPARFVIHTVGPRYNIKYKTAAESALYNCYRHVLLLAKENHISTLTLPAIHSVRRGYPPEDGAHIALRTVRRILEKHSDAFDLLVFTINGVDESVYLDLLRLYFPRNKIEEQWAVDLLPKDIGNEEGEPVIAERQIRITGDPTMLAAEKDEDDLVDVNLAYANGHNDFEEVRGHAFTSVERDPDSIKTERFSKKQGEPSEFEISYRYERFLRKARVEDLSDIAAHRCMYQSGTDVFGRPIVVFVARNFPATTVNLGKALLYFIYLLDPIVSKDYVMVYFHTLCTADNQPSFSWLKHVYQSLDARYRRNLKSFYVVHPTFWSRLLIWYFTTFTAGRIKNKVHIMNSVHSLYDNIPNEQLDIPPFVLDYDMTLNSSNYNLEYDGNNL